jgi:hypothetical protein
MAWIKRIIFGLLIIVLVGFLHYTLPSRDIVQIVGTDVKRMDVGQYAWFWASPDANTNTNYTRDVRFINAAWPNGDPRVYRNEDTNWSWPPYLKFDSGNINAEAQALAKSQETIWVAVSHYGWRIKLLSIFPNAYRIKQVEGPSAFLIPWFNIVFIGALISFIWIIIRAVRRFKNRHVDPITNQMSDAVDTVGEYAQSANTELSNKGSGIRKFFRRWFGVANRK